MTKNGFGKHKSRQSVDALVMIRLLVLDELDICNVNFKGGVLDTRRHQQDVKRLRWGWRTVICLPRLSRLWIAPISHLSDSFLRLLREFFKRIRLSLFALGVTFEVTFSLPTWQALRLHVSPCLTRDWIADCVWRIIYYMCQKIGLLSQKKSCTLLLTVTRR